jgi:hypothetical protein
LSFPFKVSPTCILRWVTHILSLSFPHHVACGHFSLLYIPRWEPTSLYAHSLHILWHITCYLHQSCHSLLTTRQSHWHVSDHDGTLLATCKTCATASLERKKTRTPREGGGSGKSGIYLTSVVLKNSGSTGWSMKADILTL